MLGVKICTLVRRHTSRHGARNWILFLLLGRIKMRTTGENGSKANRVIVKIWLRFVSLLDEQFYIRFSNFAKSNYFVLCAIYHIYNTSPNFI